MVSISVVINEESAVLFKHTFKSASCLDKFLGIFCWGAEVHIEEERLSSRQTESYHCERSCGFCAFACEQEYLVE
jgi:hypothetical protein